MDAADRRGARYDWIRSTRMLIDNIDNLPLSEEERRSILAPLRRDIRIATRTRAGNSTTEDPTAEDSTETETETPAASQGGEISTEA